MLAKFESKWFCDKGVFLLIILSLFLSQKSVAQVEFQICITSSWQGGGTGEITILNNTPNSLPANSTLELDWQNINSISPFWGVVVNGNGPFNFVFSNPVPAGGSSGAIGFNFTKSSSFFTPISGLMNGDTVHTQLPQCYAPPSYSNFDCETTISKECLHSTTEILLGEGTLNVWNASLDAYIPENKKEWAIGMAVAHSTLSNLLGGNYISINEYFATALQESNCGCDGTIIDPGWVSNSYPDHENNNPIYCYDYSYGVAVGFFQIEHGTGWAELSQDIPCFVPGIDFDRAIVGKNMPSQLIGKTYHDFNNLMYLQYIKCFDVQGFFEGCQDPYGPEKILSAAYNRGMNAGLLEDILVTQRAAAISSPDLLQFMTGLGQQYAEQISRMTAVLDGNLGDVSSYGASTYGITWPGPHNHYGFYDEQIAWADFETYLDSLNVIFDGLSINMSLIKSKCQTTFNSINSGASISYRYQLQQVIDSLVTYLPAFDPAAGLGEVYGSSGGDACTIPTGRIEGDTIDCGGGSPSLTVYLTGEAPWDITIENQGVFQSYSSIQTSPAQIPVSGGGAYQLSSVIDANGNSGQVICGAVEIIFTGNSLPDIIIATPDTLTCDNSNITIDGSGSSGNNLTFEWSTSNGNIVGPDSLNMVSINAPGNYVLSVIDQDGCVSNASVAVLIDTLPPSINLGDDLFLTCNDSLAAINVIPDDFEEVAWVLNGIDTIQNNSSLIVSTPGEIIAVVTGYNGCLNFDTIYVNKILPAVVASIHSVDTSGPAPLQVLLTDSSQGNIDSLFWDLGNGDTGFGNSISTIYNDTGSYWCVLIAYDTNGCYDVDSLFIQVAGMSWLTIPNIFTPNGDGVNDEWKISYEYIYDPKIQIYNRWGQVVFEKGNLDEKWDGSNLIGEKCPEGTYYYLLEALDSDGGIINKSGVMYLRD